MRLVLTVGEDLEVGEDEVKCESLMQMAKEVMGVVLMIPMVEVFWSVHMAATGKLQE